MYWLSAGNIVRLCNYPVSAAVSRAQTHWLRADGSDGIVTLDGVHAPVCVYRTAFFLFVCMVHS